MSTEFLGFDPNEEYDPNAVAEAAHNEPPADWPGWEREEEIQSPAPMNRIARAQYVQWANARIADPETDDIGRMLLGLYGEIEFLKARVDVLESDPRLLPFEHGLEPIRNEFAEHMARTAPDYPLEREREFAARPLVLMGKPVTVAVNGYARTEAGRALNLRERA